MKTVKAISLLIIAAVLTVQFSLSYLVPAFYRLRFDDDAYQQSAAACMQAEVSYRDANYLSDALGEGVRSKLIQASRLELVACHNHYLLKAQLIQQGINAAQLRVLELKAAEMEGLPLSTLIDPYEGR